jgi:hypothetical protein
MNLQEQISRIQSMMGVNESFLDWFKSPNNDLKKSKEEREFLFFTYFLLLNYLTF